MIVDADVSDYVEFLAERVTVRDVGLRKYATLVKGAVVIHSRQYEILLADVESVLQTVKRLERAPGRSSIIEGGGLWEEGKREEGGHGTRTGNQERQAGGGRSSNSNRRLPVSLADCLHQHGDPADLDIFGLEDHGGDLIDPLSQPLFFEAPSLSANADEVDGEGTLLNLVPYGGSQPGQQDSAVSSAGLLGEFLQEAAAFEREEGFETGSAAWVGEGGEPSRRAEQHSTHLRGGLEAAAGFGAFPDSLSVDMEMFGESQLGASQVSQGGFGGLSQDDLIGLSVDMDVGLEGEGGQGVAGTGRGGLEGVELDLTLVEEFAGLAEASVSQFEDSGRRGRAVEEDEAEEGDSRRPSLSMNGGMPGSSQEENLLAGGEVEDPTLQGPFGPAGPLGSSLLGFSLFRGFSEDDRERDRAGVGIQISADCLLHSPDSQKKRKRNNEEGGEGDGDGGNRFNSNGGRMAPDRSPSRASTVSSLQSSLFGPRSSRIGPRSMLASGARARARERMVFLRERDRAARGMGREGIPAALLALIDENTELEEEEVNAWRYADRQAILRPQRPPDQVPPPPRLQRLGRLYNASLSAPLYAYGGEFWDEDPDLVPEKNREDEEEQEQGGRGSVERQSDQAEDAHQQEGRETDPMQMPPDDPPQQPADPFAPFLLSDDLALPGLSQGSPHSQSLQQVEREKEKEGDVFTKAKCAEAREMAAKIRSSRRKARGQKEKEKEKQKEKEETAQQGRRERVESHEQEVGGEGEMSGVSPAGDEAARVRAPPAADDPDLLGGDVSASSFSLGGRRVVEGLGLDVGVGVNVSQVSDLVMTGGLTQEFEVDAGMSQEAFGNEGGEGRGVESQEGIEGQEGAAGIVEQILGGLSREVRVQGDGAGGREEIEMEGGKRGRGEESDRVPSPGSPSPAAAPVPPADRSPILEGVENEAPAPPSSERGMGGLGARESAGSGGSSEGRVSLGSAASSSSGHSGGSGWRSMSTVTDAEAECLQSHLCSRLVVRARELARREADGEEGGLRSSTGIVEMAGEGGGETSGGADADAEALDTAAAKYLPKVAMTFQDIAPPGKVDRETASYAFRQLLTLATCGAFEVKQGEPAGPILLKMSESTASTYASQMVPRPPSAVPSPSGSPPGANERPEGDGRDGGGSGQMGPSENAGEDRRGERARGSSQRGPSSAPAHSPPPAAPANLSNVALQRGGMRGRRGRQRS
uniref:Rad21/Rec8-like protein N-terminal domain-containing protein n=1 Tax=Chromera velia CCMP2878 TaxID=1169474 RepID=A0A0G4HPN9_9ALVE|eukprot:Cvel_7808.t1-p1 / transcript=Cvel_7808.t1 / gene=Cvel_7808 / organism=Chromera_velia_CCMP2878 / gene_product=hypothetical protein / transcript_product=hypothetical protein / location=Cvel_scaffold417:3621-11129(-) / protein_length=1210 / sequence_SO=supercontig / SO=protein_coding / is_pseudo=false